MSSEVIWLLRATGWMRQQNSSFGHLERGPGRAVSASESVNMTKGMSCANIHGRMAVSAQSGSRAPGRDRRMGFSAPTG
jgi:hypothetical protein